MKYIKQLKEITMVGNSITLGAIILFILFFPKLFLGLIGMFVAFIFGVTL